MKLGAFLVLASEMFTLHASISDWVSLGSKVFLFYRISFGEASDAVVIEIEARPGEFDDIFLSAL